MLAVDWHALFGTRKSANIHWRLNFSRMTEGLIPAGLLMH